MRWQVLIWQGVVFLVFLGGCTRWFRQKKDVVQLPSYNISLHVGVYRLILLGETEIAVLKRFGNSGRKLASTEVLLPATQGGKLNKYEMVQMGLRFYTRSGRVVLIELQEPFRGHIQGTPFTVFDFKRPDEGEWSDILKKHLGRPEAEAIGGRLGSRAFFYKWGDIAFNKMGINELALYRDKKLRELRFKHFGRVVRLFSDS